MQEINYREVAVRQYLINSLESVKGRGVNEAIKAIGSYQNIASEYPNEEDWHISASNAVKALRADSEKYRSLYISYVKSGLSGSLVQGFSTSKKDYESTFELNDQPMPEDWVASELYSGEFDGLNCVADIYSMWRIIKGAEWNIHEVIETDDGYTLIGYPASNPHHLFKIELKRVDVFQA